MAQQAVPLTFKQLEQKMAANPKPVVVTVYTNWCMYCKLQKTQLKKTGVQQLLSGNYYWVNFNAEDKSTIHFNGDSYTYLPAYKVNKLAGVLAAQNGQLSYPTLVILDKNYRMQYRMAGVVKSKALTQILTRYK